MLSLGHRGIVEVHGDGNRLVDNFVDFLDGDRGMGIFGNNNVVRRNRVIGNFTDNPFLFVVGILVSGTGNDLRHNTALENGVGVNSVDLRDANGNCVQNTWKFNTFLTADPKCIQ